MSDPMTNSEVEDVLSSIRRLVSDEKRFEPIEEERPKPATDRLVLTPSLRVTEADETRDGWPEVDETPVESPEADETLAGWPEVDEAPVESPEADETLAGWPEVDETPVESLEADEIADKDISGADTLDENLPDQADTDTMSALILKSDDLSKSDDASQMTDKQDSPGHFEPSAFAAFDARDEFEFAEATTEGSDLDDDHSDDIVDDKDAASETLGEKIAALETLIAGRADVWEPDQAGTDAYAGTEPPAMAWEDTEDTEDDGATDVDKAHVQDIPDPQVFGAKIDVEDATRQADTARISADDDVLDEDALRELVSDIVREELQGALGERITRNVRKLVRRELHRALAAQDLE